MFWWKLLNAGAMLLLDLTGIYRGRGLEAYSRVFLNRFLRSYLEEHSLDQYRIEMLPYYLKLFEIELYAMLYQGYDPSDSESWIGRIMSGRQRRIENDILIIEIDFGSLAK